MWCTLQYIYSKMSREGQISSKGGGGGECPPAPPPPKCNPEDTMMPLASLGKGDLLGICDRL